MPIHEVLINQSTNHSNDFITSLNLPKGRATFNRNMYNKHELYHHSKQSNINTNNHLASIRDFVLEDEDNTTLQYLQTPGIRRH